MRKFVPVLGTLYLSLCTSVSREFFRRLSPSSMDKWGKVGQGAPLVTWQRYIPGDQGDVEARYPSLMCKCQAWRVSHHQLSLQSKTFMISLLWSVWLRLEVVLPVGKVTVVTLMQYIFYIISNLTICVFEKKTRACQISQLQTRVEKNSLCLPVS